MRCIWGAEDHRIQKVECVFVYPGKYNSPVDAVRRRELGRAEGRSTLDGTRLLARRKVTHAMRLLFNEGSRAGLPDAAKPSLLAMVNAVLEGMY